VILGLTLHQHAHGAAGTAVLVQLSCGAAPVIVNSIAGAPTAVDSCCFAWFVTSCLDKAEAY